jgi:hypothetical protein
VDGKAPPPVLVAGDMDARTASLLGEVRELTRKFEAKQAERVEVDRSFQGFMARADYAAWFLLVGTILLALAEGVKWWFQ